MFWGVWNCFFGVWTCSVILGVRNMLVGCDYGVRAQGPGPTEMGGLGAGGGSPPPQEQKVCTFLGLLTTAEHRSSHTKYKFARSHGSPLSLSAHGVVAADAATIQSRFRANLNNVHLFVHTLFGSCS